MATGSAKLDEAVTDYVRIISNRIRLDYGAAMSDAELRYVSEMLLGTLIIGKLEADKIVAKKVATVLAQMVEATARFVSRGRDKDRCFGMMIDLLMECDKSLSARQRP